MKSFRTIISAGFLASALVLAGCGGGSSDDDTVMPPPPPPPTPEEACAAMGQGYAIDNDGKCKSLDEARQEGMEAEAEERDAAAAAKAREEMAEKLHGLLAISTVSATAERPTNAGTGSADLEKALENVDDGEGMAKKAHVMVDNDKGPMVKVSTLPGSESLTSISTLSSRHISGSGFATGSAEKKEHDDGSTVRGHYRGASGGYVCTSDCTSQRTANGGIILGGTWASFDLDAGQQFDAEDMLYAEWGWWIDEGIADGDPANDKVGAWYNVMGTAITETAVTNASGKATYRGQAVGKAAYYSSQSDSNVGGAFTADAELKADFDDGNGMLSGSITGFEIGGMNPDWSVELMKHVIAGTGVAATLETSDTKWTIGGTTDEARGSWSAQFYDVPKGEHQPSGVAGGFEAQYDSDGYMVGSFGAER